MRFHLEQYQLPAITCVNGGMTAVMAQFPLGEGWYKMNLQFALSYTSSGGSGPITEGELLYIKNILLRTDRDGVVINCPGRGLFRLAQFKLGTAPYKDAIAAGTAVYNVSIPLLFANPMLKRKEDSILDTSRYHNVELDVTLGTVADLMGTVGSDSVATTLNITLTRTKGLVPAKGGPLVLPYMVAYPIAMMASQSAIDIERAYDLAVNNLFFLTTNSATAGVGFSGTPSNAPIADASFLDNLGVPYNKILAQNILTHNKENFMIETWPTGWYGFNFNYDGSIFSAYATGNKSMARLIWTNGTLSTSGVTALLDGIRQFKK